MGADGIATHIAGLRDAAQKIEEQIDAWQLRMAGLAHDKYKYATNFLFLGRGIHHAIAREGALKVKESSYVHAEGYPTGELKHGPNAMVDDKVPLLVLATVDWTLDDSVLRYKKTLQLLRDMKAQGAKVLAVANLGDEEVASLVCDCVYVQPMSEYLLPMIEVVPLQLFAYFMGLEHGVDVDRLRNISKVVLDRELVK
jgi:glucosamine--fructose-6-phosphate aminotransferase (isomerizing)